MDPEDRDRLEEAKRSSPAQLLLRCARLLDELALARLRATTGVQVRPAHTRLFPHIALEGTRPTELARRVGVSKQAIGQLVGELEAMGVLERIPDPTDGRATLVRFADLEALHHGLAELRRVEDELAKRVGAERLRDLHEALLAIEPVLSSGELLPDRPA